MRRSCGITSIVRHTFKIVNRNLAYLTCSGNQNSEAAVCEFLVSPVFRAIMGKDYNPLHVFIPSRANNAVIRADYVLKRKILIEAKNLKVENLVSKLEFKNSKNKDGNHLSQAVFYFVEIKHVRQICPDLQHIILTNGKLWYVFENIEEQFKQLGITVKTLEDLEKLNKLKVPPKAEEYTITSYPSFSKLMAKLFWLLNQDEI